MIKAIHKKNINDLLLACIIISNFIAPVLNLYGISGVIGIIYLVTLLYGIFFIRKLNKKHFSFAVLMSLPWFLSIFRYGIDSPQMFIFLLNYLTFIIPGIYILNFDFDFDSIISNIILIYTAFIPLIIKIDFALFDFGSQMGWSYSLLPLFMSIIYFLFNHNNISWKKMIIYLTVALIYLYKIISVFSRGPILIISLYILYYSLRKREKYRNFYIILASLVIISIYVNLELLFKLFNDLLQQIGVSIRFFEKTIILLMQDDITNGRSELIHLGLERFSNRPIVGNGIGDFYRTFYLNYEHSLPVQLLNETGIIYFFVHAWLLFKGLIIMFASEIKNQDFIAFLFFISVIRLFISSSLWLNQAYWLFLFLVYIIPKKLQ